MDFPCGHSDDDSGSRIIRRTLQVQLLALCVSGPLVMSMTFCSTHNYRYSPTSLNHPLKIKYRVAQKVKPLFDCLHLKNAYIKLHDAVFICYRQACAQRSHAGIVFT